MIELNISPCSHNSKLLKNNNPNPKNARGWSLFFELNIIKPSKQPKHTMKNVPLHTKCQVLCHVIASATEAELGALFRNGQTTTPLRTTLEDLGQQQPPTPIETDNYTAFGIVNSTFKQRTSKTIDMRLYWVKD